MAQQLDPSIFGDDLGERRKCAADGCSRKAGAHKRHCPAHQARIRRGIPLDKPIRSYGVMGVCSINGCSRRAVCKGLCPTHDNRKRLGFEDWDRYVPKRASRVRVGNMRFRDEAVAVIDRQAELLGMNRRQLVTHIVEEWAKTVTSRKKGEI